MLSKKIETIKNDYYLKKNNEDFNRKCAVELTLSMEIEQFCSEKNIKIETYPNTDEPSQEWRFYYEKYVNENFSIAYESILTISKLETIYSLKHRAEIPNLDPQRLDRKIITEDDSPLCYSQNDLQKIIETTLNNYDSLKWIDQFELVNTLQFSEKNGLYGTQVRYFELAFINLIDEIIPR
ncbi:hypothetical protein ACYSNR_06930 [Enterococcus sp. LJL128]